MISWLKGKIIHSCNDSSKIVVVIDVQGVGYEVQILQNEFNIIKDSKGIEFWVHQINREESINLYGFLKLEQRDFFRRVISVTGIGPQIGMALLEKYEINQLVNAIEENDVNLLTNSKGIGKRIAERLIVELKDKLHQFNDNKEINNYNQKTKSSTQIDKYIEEIKSTLNSLGYLDNEIKDSIKLIISKEKEKSLLLNTFSAEEKNELLNKDIKKILIVLSQKNT